VLQFPSRALLSRSLARFVELSAEHETHLTEAVNGSTNRPRRH